VIGVTARIPVFTTQVYYLVFPPSGGLPNYGMSATFAMLIVAIALVLMFLYTRITRRAEKYTTITGKGYRSRPIDLGRFRYVAFWRRSLLCYPGGDFACPRSSLG